MNQLDALFGLLLIEIGGQGGQGVEHIWSQGYSVRCAVQDAVKFIERIGGFTQEQFLHDTVTTTLSSGLARVACDWRCGNIRSLDGACREQCTYSVTDRRWI